MHPKRGRASSSPPSLRAEQSSTQPPQPPQRQYGPYIPPAPDAPAADCHCPRCNHVPKLPRLQHPAQVHGARPRVGALNTQAIQPPNNQLAAGLNASCAAAPAPNAARPPRAPPGSFKTTFVAAQNSGSGDRAASCWNPFQWPTALNCRFPPGKIFYVEFYIVCNGHAMSDTVKFTAPAFTNDSEARGRLPPPLKLSTEDEDLKRRQWPGGSVSR